MWMMTMTPTNITAENLARRSRNQNSEYLAQRGKALSFRPKGEIFPRSLASARDDGPWARHWRHFGFAQDRLGASKSPFWIATGRQKICASSENLNVAMQRLYRISFLAWFLVKIFKPKL